MSLESRDPECPRFHPRGNQLLDACIEHDVILQNPPGIHTWRQGDRSSLIDLVLASRDIAEGATCTILPFGPASDHAPLLLVAPLTYTDKSYIAIIPDSDQEATFVRCIAMRLRLVNGALNISLDEEHVESMFRFLDTSLQEAYREAASEHNPSSRGKGWWNQSCSLAKARYHEDHSPEHKRDYRATIRSAKRQYFDSVIERAAETHRPWDLLSWTRARQQPRHLSPIVFPENTPTNPQCLFDRLHAQFTGAPPPTTSPNLASVMESRPMRDWPPISANEVKHILKKAKKRSAPGGDHISWTLLRKACEKDPNLPRVLAQIFSKLITAGIMPSHFKHAETAVIPKPGKPDYTILKAWRPIALLSCMAKLLMGTIARRFQFDAVNCDLVHPNQFGGVIGRSALDAALLLTERLTQAKHRGVASSLLGIDIAQFFPSIQHDLLLEVLRRQGFNTTITTFLRSYLSNRTVRYRWGNAQSQIYPFSVGIPQGCKISPIIAALFIAPALRSLQSADPDDNDVLISFVDDTVILTQSRSLAANAARLTHLYQKYKERLGSFDLHIEHSKTELFHARHYQTHLPYKRLYDGPLPNVTISTPQGPLEIKPSMSWRYLGFFFDPALSFDSHVEKWTNKAYGSLRAMKMLGNSCRGMPPSCKRLLYLTAVLPVMTYGFQLWYRPENKGCKKYTRKLAAVQHAAARWITGAFSTSPAGALEALGGLPAMPITLRNLYNSTIVRFGLLHQRHGLLCNALPPLSWDVQTAGTIRSGPTGTFILPPFRKPRKSIKRPPVEVLRDLAFALQEPSPHITAKPPGHRLLDLFAHRITHQQYPPKTEDLDDWARLITDALDAPFAGHSMYLVASTPASIHTGLGAFAYAHLVPGAVEPYLISCPVSATNHHEISLVGLMHALESLRAIKGPVRILMRNQAAATTALSETYQRNRHYARKADSLLQQWFNADPTNILTFGWLPKQYRTDPITRLEILCKRTKTRREGDLRYMSAASFLHEERKTSNNLRDLDVLSPKYVGSSFMRLKSKGRRILPRNKQALKYIHACRDQPLLFARFTRAMTSHAPIGSYYKRFPHIGKDHRCPSPPPRGHPYANEESRSHILNSCSRFSRYWEDWLTELRLRDNSLELLVDFLVRNSQAFAFA